MLLYITVMIKPLIPIIGNLWSHEFNEIEHISSIHAKYGSHHLQRELAESSADNEKGKDQNSLKYENQYPVHLIAAEYHCTSTVYKIDIKYLAFLLNKLTSEFIFNQTPPPKFYL